MPRAKQDRPDFRSGLEMNGRRVWPTGPLVCIATARTAAYRRLRSGEAHVKAATRPSGLEPDEYETYSTHAKRSTATPTETSWDSAEHHSTRIHSGLGAGQMRSLRATTSSGRRLCEALGNAHLDRPLWFVSVFPIAARSGRDRAVGLRQLACRSRMIAPTRPDDKSPGPRGPDAFSPTGGSSRRAALAASDRRPSCQRISSPTASARSDAASPAALTAYAAAPRA